MRRSKSAKRWVAVLSSAAAAVTALVQPAVVRANTEYDVVNGQADLTSAGTYTVSGSPAVTPPDTEADVTLQAGVGYSPSDFTVNSNLSIGTLNFLDNSQTFSISNTSTSGSGDMLTLNGGTNGVAPNSADLLYVASSNTLTINGGSSSTTLGLSLAAAGNLDIAGTATISSVITGTNGLTLTGGGTLTLSGANSNTLTGTVTITAGTLKLGSATALGAAANPVTVASGATLDINGNSITPHSGTITINGTGAGSIGAALINTGSGSGNPGVGSIALGSDATVSSGPNRMDLYGVNANGFALTKIGTGYMAMKGATSSLTTLNINQGSWEVSTATGLGVNASTTVDTIASVASLDFYNAPAAPYLTTIDLNGGQIYLNSGSVTLNGPVVLGASSTLNAAGGPIVIGGVISGTGNLTTWGSVTLSGANTYSGNTAVNSGTLTISNTTGSGTSTGNVTVGSKFALVLNHGTASGNVTLAATTTGSTTLTSTSGTIGGDLTLGANATAQLNGGTVGGNATLGTNATTLLNAATIVGNVTLGNGSILSTGATGTVDGSLTGPASGTAATLEPGGVYATTRVFGTLNVGSLAATPLTTLNFDLSTPTASDLINVTATDGFTVSSGTPLTFGAAPASPGTFNLVSYNIDANGTAPDPGSFAVSLALNPRLSYTLQETAGTTSSGVTPYDLQLVVTGGAPTTATFIGTTGTSASPNDWNDSTQWLNGTVGGLQGDTVNFNNGDSLAGTVYVNLNGQQHVGTLNFNNTGTDAFNIGAGTNPSVTPALYLDNGSSAASITNSTNNNTIAAPVVVFSNTTVTAASGTTLTFSGPVSGSATLTIPSSNAGTIVLSGANTNTGGISLTGGLLALNSAGALGTGTFTLNAGATFDNTSGAAVTLSTIAPQTWAGDFTFVGTQNLNMGTGKITLSTSPTITVNANTLTIAGGITGAHGFTKAGSGTLWISSNSAANTFTGPVVVNAGILELTGSNNNSSGALATTPSITVNAGAELLVIGSSNDTLGYYGGRDALIINDGTVLNNGSGKRMTLQNAVTMTGGTLGGTSLGDTNGAYSFDVNGTDVIATSDAAGNPAMIGNATGTSMPIGVQTPSTFNVTRGTSSNLTAAMPDLVVTASLIIFPKTTGSVNKTGSGIMVFSGANTYPGTTTVSAGSLRVNGTNTGAGAVTVAAGATLGGSGSVAGATTVNGTITAGPDALTSGLFTTAAMTWPSNGNYLFKLASNPSGSSAGSPAAGGTSSTWDEIAFSTLSLTSTTTSPFTVTLDYTGSGFDSSSGFTIPIAYGKNANAINNGTAYSPAQIVLASIGNTLPPQTSASDFSVMENANNSEIDLVYTPAPEPTSLALLGLASAGALLRRRRERRSVKA